MIRLDLPRPIRFVPRDLRTAIAEELANLGSHRAFLVTSERMQRRACFADVLDGVRDTGAHLETWARAPAEPGPGDLDAAYAAARAAEPDVVIGLGGGSAMDLAKLASILIVNGPPIERYYGVRKVPCRGLPTVMVPTTAGSGSEVSQDAVLTDRSAGTKLAVKDPRLVASAAIVDPAATADCPPELTATCGADAFTHALEALTARTASVISDLFAEKAIALLWRHLPAAVRAGDDLEQRSAVSLGALLAGVAFTTTGTAAVHACGYPLSGTYGISHGAANALMLPAVVAFNAAACSKYERLRRLLGADDLRAALEGFVTEIGLPIRLRDVGVPLESLPQLARIAASDERHLSVNPRPMGADDLERVFVDAW